MSLLDALLLDPAPFNVWVAYRKDGVKGSGTLNDPWDGSTAARFDGIMRSLPSDVPVRVHLGPSTASAPFITQGYYDGAASDYGWRPRAGMKLIGSGMDATYLKLADNLASNQHHFAIGHPLAIGTQPNLMDGFEVDGLTIDANFANQSGSSVACGAVRVMGNGVRLRRIKVLHWGTKDSARPCFVLATITGTVVDSTVSEFADCGIQECIALLPGASANGGIVTVYHAGGEEAAGSFVEAYGQGPFIRDSLVDGGSIPASYTIRALSMGWCKNGVVQGNQIYNVTHGGPYQDKASSRDLVVLGNYFKNVLRGPYWNLGGTNPTSPTTLNTLVRSSPATIALATTSANPHNLQAGERIKIGGTGNVPGEFKGVFVIKDVPAANQFRYQMLFAPTQDAPSSEATMQKVFGLNKLLVEGNNVELAAGSTAAAAIQVHDGEPASQTPDCVHGDIAVRGNTVRYVDGLFDPSYTGYAIEMNGVKNLAVRDNVVDCAPANPIRNRRCGSVTYFNNKTAAGALVQGVNVDQSNKKYDELATDAEDAFLLAFMRKR